MSTPALPRRFSPYVRLAILFIGYFVIDTFIAVITGLLFGNELSDAAQDLMRAVVFAVTVGFVAFLTVKVDRRPLSVLRLRLDRHAVTAFGISLVVIAVMMTLSAMIANALWAASLAPVEPTAWNTLFSGLIAAFVLQGFPEEMAFRGYLTQTFDTTPLRALMITSLAFMAFHWHFILAYQGIDIVINLAYALFLGAFAFVMAQATNTVWAAVAVHGGAHSVHTILEILGYADGGIRVLLQAVLLAAGTLAVLIVKRKAFTL